MNMFDAIASNLRRRAMDPLWSGHDESRLRLACLSFSLGIAGLLCRAFDLGWRDGYNDCPCEPVVRQPWDWRPNTEGRAAP